MNLVTIGADPELFLTTKDGTFVNSLDKFGGTKEVPYPIGQGCAVQEDNVAVEFNIPPQSTVERFIESINYSLKNITETAKQLDLQLAIVPAAYFPRAELVDPRAQEFGCEPDLNAWTLKTNPKPRAVNPILRSAGGHVHVGCKEFAPYDIARVMDLFLGVPSLAVDRDRTRRELYGKAGAYRVKPYGMEYRTLSNFWIKNEQLMKWVFHQTHRALEWLDMGNRLRTNEGKDIQKCINNSDEQLYEALMNRYGLEAAVS